MNSDWWEVQHNKGDKGDKGDTLTLAMTVVCDRGTPRLRADIWEQGGDSPVAAVGVGRGPTLLAQAH